jgi:hypothetical protein
MRFDWYNKDVCRTTAFVSPPPGYRKKVINQGEGCPLTDTFTTKQVETRVAFYRELNIRRQNLSKGGETDRRVYNLYGWEDTTTVRVYMRETVSRIAAQLLTSAYQIEVHNINHVDRNEDVDKDHGYVQVYVRALRQEIDALGDYIYPGASYYVYDGEKRAYVPGNTRASAFIITKPNDPL